MSQHLLTPAQDAQIISRYLAGECPSQIAPDFGIAVDCVSKMMKRLGLRRTRKECWTHRTSPFRNHRLTGRQRAVILGSILGDGGIYLIGGCSNARFREKHGPKQSDYLQWKYAELKPLSRSVLVSRTEFQFSTSVTREFTELRALCYVNDKKVITTEFLKLIVNPLTIAVWIADDGSRIRSGHQIVMATDGFSGNECQLLCDHIRTQFGYRCRTWTWPRTGLTRIILEHQTVHSIRDLYLAEMPKCMHYKMPIGTRWGH